MPVFSTTITNSIALKAPLASPTFTGTATAPKFRATSQIISADNMFMAGGQFYLGAEDSNTNDTYRMYGYDAGKFILQTRKSGTWTTRFEISSAGAAAFSGTVTWSSGGSANANTAYTHSQASHAPTNAEANRAISDVVNSTSSTQSASSQAAKTAYDRSWPDTTYSAGTGLGISGTTFSAKLDDLPDMTQTWANSTDEFIVLDSGAQKRKLSSEIFGSNAFNSTAFTTNTGDITSVGAGAGISGGGTSGSVVMTLALSELTSSNAPVTGDKLVFIDNGVNASFEFSDLPLSIFNNDSGWNNYSFPYTISQSEGNNTVVRRHASGYIYGNYFNGSGTFSATGNTSGMALFTGTSGGDTFGRSYTAAAARTLLNVADGATNTVGNATHTGEVTGSTSLTIASNVVDEANLKVSNAPTDGYVLTARSAATGDMTWEAVSGGGSSTVLDMDKYLHVGMMVATTGNVGEGDGGTLTSNTWTTRDLNHVWENNGSLASNNEASMKSSNYVTLPAGDYYVKFWAIGFGVEEHQAQLVNGTTVLVHGSNGRSTSSYTSSATANQSVGAGIVSWSSGTKNFSIRHIVDRTRANFGGGMEITQGYNSTISTSNVVYNTYWGLEIWKIS